MTEAQLSLALTCHPMGNISPQQNRYFKSSPGGKQMTLGLLSQETPEKDHTPKPNISREEILAIKELKEDQSRIILTTDREVALVM